MSVRQRKNKGKETPKENSSSSAPSSPSSKLSNENINNNNNNNIIKNNLEEQKENKNNLNEIYTQKTRPFYYNLFDPVDNSTLIFFRIFWGLIMLYECYTYIRNDYSKLENYYLRSEFYPKYYLFDWVNAWPGNGMYIHIWCMALMSTFITIGFLYRISSFLFFLGFFYIFLIDSCLYLNHFYLICVMAFLLVLLPANKDVSVDAWLFPNIRSNVMPRYILYLLRIEQVCYYCFLFLLILFFLK